MYMLLNSGGKDSGRCMSKGVADCTVHGGLPGRILRNQVKIPKHSSKHTILAFRWDCMDTGQLWLNCADIEIV